MRRLTTVIALAFALECPQLLQAARDPISLVKVGDTEQHVKKVLGENYRICQHNRTCIDPVWLYQIPRGKPSGVAVRFRNGHVIAVFRLGVVAGRR